jgi:hypothetical protein
MMEDKEVSKLPFIINNSNLRIYSNASNSIIYLKHWNFNLKH